MNEKVSVEIEKASCASFIDRNIACRKEFQATIIDNDYGNIPLSEELGNNLRLCSSFIFSVAFINQSGLEVILQPLKEAIDAGKKGYILTTDYLCFSEPKALERLMRISPNLEIKIITEDAFHTKGYCFLNDNDTSTIIIGSSNLTQGALKSNHEWNVRLISSNNGSYYFDFDKIFKKLWDKALPLSVSWLEEYKKRYTQNKILQRKVRLPIPVIKPNKMQEMASESLKKLRAEGKHKALIIAATGTGKTLLSCFDVNEYNPKRLLFLVHREQILKNAAEAFIQVLGQSIKHQIGFLSGGKHDYQKRYVFATINTLYNEVKNRTFPPDYFDYVIIDEVHKAGAPTYQEIIEYLKPDFLLGMSATPDRSDEYNIYSLFDYTIACDIRLKEALENDLLCPFHYFGITDIYIDNKLLDENSTFNSLATEERARNILEKSEFYGYSGDRVKGLIFCSRVEEAQELSKIMNTLGHKTVAVSGETSIKERISYTDRLQQNNIDGNELDYILSVDVFNEGVDIPDVNQVIMLRPTQSSIIFIQQLGRGLRKSEGKEFLVVIDFIANYKNNYLIPIALSGDSSYNKDNLRRDVFESFMIIPGCSSVHFDPIARNLIYKKIDEANLSSRKFLENEYKELKKKIGRIPMIRDFRADGSIDIQRYLDVYDSYYSFLVEKEPDFKIRLNMDESRFLFYISKSFSNGKRDGELRVLKELIRRSNQNKVADPTLNIDISESVKSSLDLSFVKKSDRDKRFKNCEILDENGYVTLPFLKALNNDDFKMLLEDIIEDGLYRYEKTYSHKYENTDLVLYEKYTYEDVCRLLGWKKNVNAQNIGGYKYDHDTKTLPVFINYEKDESAIKYEDRFISEREIIALSKRARSIDGPDADHIYKRTKEDEDNRIYLFVRKDKDSDDKKEFYFLGEINAVGEPKIIKMDEKDNAFEIDYILSHPVRRDIYDYLTAKI